MILKRVQYDVLVVIVVTVLIPVPVPVDFVVLTIVKFVLDVNLNLFQILII